MNKLQGKKNENKEVVGGNHTLERLKQINYLQFVGII
jgi:hypothetical protein